MAERDPGGVEAGRDELDAARVFFAGAARSTPDGQGRVADPAGPARVRAASTKDVIVAGAFHRVEIWDAERWRQRKGGGQGTASPPPPRSPEFGI